jgi:hypothetical protein
LVLKARKSNTNLQRMFTKRYGKCNSQKDHNEDARGWQIDKE